MARVLVLFAHPALQTSRVHRRLVGAVPVDDDLTFHDLYEAYPDLAIDVHREQRLLLDHDVIVLQFPFYWYSTPPILKQWFDLVLEHRWAYGSEGTALAGKTMVCALSAGGRESAYCDEGYNRYTLPDFLRPIERTAILCRMTWLPPWVVCGTHSVESAGIEAWAEEYGRVLRWLLDDGHAGEAPDIDETLNRHLRSIGVLEAAGAEGSR